MVRDPKLHEKHVERIKDEVSGISERESAWWKHTQNLCSSVSRACDKWFERRGFPRLEFNCYEYETDKPDTDQTISD